MRGPRSPFLNNKGGNKMESNNINTEFILLLFLRFYPKLLSKVIGYNVEDIQLEKNCFKRKIDGYSKMEGKEIFLEAQLGKSDELHLKQIKIIVNRLEKNRQAVVIWIANEFDLKMIQEVLGVIDRNKKNIEFIAIKTNDETIEELDNLRIIHEFKIIDNLHKVYEKSKNNDMEVVFKFYKKYREVTNIKSNKVVKQLTNKEKIMEEVLKEIRMQLYYFPTAHREKKITNTIVLGSGLADVNFRITIDRNMDLTSEIRFHDSQKEMFNPMYKNKEEIEGVLDYLIDWDLELYRIYSTVSCIKNTDMIIKRQVRVLEKLVRFFSEYKNELNNEIK